MLARRKHFLHNSRADKSKIYYVYVRAGIPTKVFLGVSPFVLMFMQVVDGTLSTCNIMIFSSITSLCTVPGWFSNLQDFRKVTVTLNRLSYSSPVSSQPYGTIL